MTGVRSAGFEQIVHIVDSDHRTRAQIAMIVSQNGGHAEIYEDIEELLGARPRSGTVLANDLNGDAAAIIARLQGGEVFLPLILFSDNPRPSQVVRAAHEGVADYLPWPFSGDDLMAACSYCQKFMSEKGDAMMRRQRARMLVESLSQRERQILAFMLQGHSNKSMANTLDLSPRTIEDYRLNAMKKLGVSATSAAIRIGLEAGLDALLPSSSPSYPALS